MIAVANKSAFMNADYIISGFCIINVCYRAYKNKHNNLSDMYNFSLAFVWTLMMLIKEAWAQTLTSSELLIDADILILISQPAATFVRVQSQLI
jgi:hypothetical protein